MLVALVLLLRPDRVLQRWPRRVAESDDQQLAAAVHAELAAGSSLRHAIAAAARLRPGLAAARRMALAGAPIEAVADAFGSGRRVAAAVVVAGRSGGRAGAVFQRLADRAAADAELARQRRVLTVQARMSAAIVGGMPVLWMLLGGAAQIRTLVASGAGVVAAAGVAMEGLGVGLIWRLALR
jgi:Flp pilus assembly protein TadB